MRILRLSLLLALLFGAGYSQAQIKKDPTTWTYEVKKTGDKQYQLITHLKLQPHWHIWSFEPGGDGMLRPPTFTFNKTPGVTLKGKVKEKGKLETKVFIEGDPASRFFEHSVDYIQEVTVTGNAKITGKHTYQVCDSVVCLREVTKPLNFAITDAGGDSVAHPDTAAAITGSDSLVSGSVNQTNTFSGAGKDSTVTATLGTKEDKKPEQTSLLLLFALCFVGGLLAITTPCVYSMVPITVSFFTKRSKTRAEAIRNAVYYSLSIIIIFTVLGVLISAVFGPQALYKLSSNWIANLFFFAVFMIFGISFLGAFEITLPSSWTSKTDSKAGTSSFKGIFFMAMTLVIVSFSCTSGIIGPLLVAASQGGLAGPALGMFGFSLGLALPFTFFAFSPGMINKMANAGGWLNQVKVTLGFIEIALALKFLSNADLVKGWRLLDREIFIALWIVIAVLLGMYLLGKLKLSHDDANAKNIYGQEYVSLFKLGLAFTSFAFAVYLLPGMWGAPLKGLGQFLPPMGTQDFVLVGGSPGQAAPAGNTVSLASADRPVKYVHEMERLEPDAVKSLGLVTYLDYEEALAAAKKANKPLMLDFTGITCVNCRKMESKVWPAPEVLSRLKNDFIIASLFCDATQVSIPESEQYESAALGTKVTNLGDRSLDIQITKFGSNAQPLYYFVDSEGTKLAADGYGYDPDIAKFVAHLEAVKAKYKELHP